jgi:hypothetical protein
MEEEPQESGKKRQSPRWEITREEIEKMSERDRVEYLVEVSEMISRLRTVVRALARDEENALTLKDVDLFLDPEEHSSDHLSSA